MTVGLGAWGGTKKKLLLSAKHHFRVTRVRLLHLTTIVFFKVSTPSLPCVGRWRHNRSSNTVTCVICLHCSEMDDWAGKGVTVSWDMKSTGGWVWRRRWTVERVLVRALYPPETFLDVWDCCFIVLGQQIYGPSTCGLLDWPECGGHCCHNTGGVQFGLTSSS